MNVLLPPIMYQKTEHKLNAIVVVSLFVYVEIVADLFPIHRMGHKDFVPTALMNFTIT